jgi:hypothetical protein
MGNLRSRTVYVVGVARNPVKIGLAAKLKERLISLQIGCPDPLIVHHSVRVPDHLGQLIESAAHRHFADRHRQGEWFNIDADEAIAELTRIAQEYCDANGALARRSGDVLDRIEASYPLDSTARTAIRHYLDRSGSPFGQKDVARWGAVLVKRCGAASYTLFKKVIGENRSLYELSLELRLDAAALSRAEAALAKAVNTLADYMAWEREQAFLKAIEARGRVMYPQGFEPQKAAAPA